MAVNILWAIILFDANCAMIYCNIYIMQNLHNAPDYTVCLKSILDKYGLN